MVKKVDMEKRHSNQGIHIKDNIWTEKCRGMALLAGNKMEGECIWVNGMMDKCMVLENILKMVKRCIDSINSAI